MDSLFLSLKSHMILSNNIPGIVPRVGSGEGEVFAKGLFVGKAILIRIGNRKNMRKREFSLGEIRPSNLNKLYLYLG